MKCPKCQTENQDGIKFCGECGAKLEIICPNCHFTNPPEFKFCGECGQDLRQPKEFPKIDYHQPQSYTPKHLAEKILTTRSAIEGERKIVTVMFTDVAGFSTMSEKLDPEDVHAVMDGCFKILMDEIHRYEGTINQFTGDGVMALFGAPIAHEDHAQRACYAALSIQHALVPYGNKLKQDYGIAFKMRIGLNSGSVVVGAIGDDLRMDYTAQGDTANLASRMESMAQPGTVLVAEATYRLVKDSFEFESQGKIPVKGKEQPVAVYRLKDKEFKARARSEREVYSEMVGRDQELDRLELQILKAVNGEGSVVNVVGEAGIGKSRLMAELKKREVVKRVMLLEGRAISMGKNLSFYPIITLLKNWAHIREDDGESAAMNKLLEAIRRVSTEEADEIFPFVATLMGMKLSGKYAERIKGIEGEALEKLIFKNVRELLIRSTEIIPVVIVIEDLHWADTSSLILIDALYRLTSTRKIVFINVFRPGYWDNEDKTPGNLKDRMTDLSLVELVLQPLDSQSSETLINNMLSIKGLHHGVKTRIIERAGGNPFFIEEVVRGLIDEGAVVVKDGGFEVTDKIHSVVIPPTINDVLMARIDRLEEKTRNLLKIASVIGRHFFYRILKEVADSIEDIDDRLAYLKDLQLIRDRLWMEELEYLFKHALAQEAVYQGLLKSARLEWHERVGLVMERLFKDRQAEFCEIIAFHFKNGRSHERAIPYLMLAGEKSIYRFAIEPAHAFYQEAYDLLENITNKTEKEQLILIDLLIQWGTVFYYRGGFNEYEALLEGHENLAVSLGDKNRLGMYYAWLGWAKYWRAKIKESCNLLDKAFKIGEEIQDQRVIGYASCWLAFSNVELGLLAEAETSAEKALNIARQLQSDQYLSSKPHTALGFIHWFEGSGRKAFRDANHLLEHGKRFENLRSTVMGYCIAGVGAFTNGDIPSAIESFKVAVDTTEDPLYKNYALVGLSFGNAAGRHYGQAKWAAKEVGDFSQAAGTEVLGTYAVIPLSVALISEGRMTKGLRQLKELSQALWSDGRKPLYVFAEHTLGSIYLQIVLGEGGFSLAVMARNIGFLIKNVPFAAKKAEEHFHKALETAREVGMKGVLGQTYLDLGILHRAKRRTQKARECLTQAIKCFEECEAETFLKRAQGVKASLG